MNSKQCSRLFLLLSVVVPCHGMSEKNMHQLAVIKSFFDTTKKITTLTTCMDAIEHNGLSYPDYDKRKGLIFSEFWVETEQTENMQEVHRRKILTLVDDELQEHSAQSSFDYPKVQKVLAQKILPKTFQCIAENKWAPLPKKVFAQFYLQRCSNGDPMTWHQDPGEYYDTMADYSLVIMLGKQNDPLFGWQGGDFRIKPGLPEDACDESDVMTIFHKYNQGVLFNNKLNSHAVTQVIGNSVHAKRDIVVVPLYFDKQPMPVSEVTNK